MSFKYYLSVWLDEFNTRWVYNNCKDGTGGQICDDEIKILKDLGSCSPASDYLDKPYTDKMKDFLEKGSISENLGEFTRDAKLNAKIGNKWYVDILLVAIKWTIFNGPGIIKDAIIIEALS